MCDRCVMVVLFWDREGKVRTVTTRAKWKRSPNSSRAFHDQSVRRLVRAVWCCCQAAWLCTKGQACAYCKLGQPAHVLRGLIKPMLASRQSCPLCCCLYTNIGRLRSLLVHRCTAAASITACRTGEGFEHCTHMP